MRPPAWVAVMLLSASAVLTGQAVDSAVMMSRRVPLGLDLYMPVPDDNPLTVEQIELGRSRVFLGRAHLDS